MADSLIQAELLAACSAIGYSDGDKYYLEADYLATIKDLIRYLRKDDDSHRIRRALGETRVLQTDLIPIVKYYNDNYELFEVALRLLVNLTNPIILLYNEELPEEKISYQQYLQILTHQQGFKKSFADDAIWKVVVGILGKILEKDWGDREEEEKLTLERILILIRNILAVPSNPEEEQRTDDDASIHDQVLWALHLSRLEDLLLYIASSEAEQDLCLHVLEIISLMLKEQDPFHLAQAGLQRSQCEKNKDEQDLLRIRERERKEREQQIKKHHNERRLGGTFYVSNMKGISDRQLITRKYVTDFKSIDFDANKKAKKIPKNRRPLQDCSTVRRSTMAIRLFLQEFCVEFLNGVYNSLMFTVKDDLNRGKTQQHDESYYLWSIRFFLNFNRNHKFKVELITESLNVQQFHYIQTLYENYFESMTTDKKKIPLWSRRMHKALEAYQELLLTLHFMDKSPDESVRESSNVLKNKVFYVVEYRELILLSLQNFNEVKMTRGYLKDLVETAHVFLKLLEGVCGKQKHLFLQEKAKKKNRRSKKQPTGRQPLTEEEKTEKWKSSCQGLIELIEGDQTLPSTVPFDVLSEENEEHHKEKAMTRIHRLLHDTNLSSAVSLLRSCREVWPENNLFGVDGMQSEEELNCLKLIFEADIVQELSEEEANENFEESEEEEPKLFSDQEFNIVEFVRRFSHSKIMQAYSILFKSFMSNSEYTNHCILKLYHRIAWDCKLPAIFFQASLFRVFQNILESPCNYSKSVKDGIQFVKFILKKFFETVNSNDKVFIEMLFWKTNREALEIEVGYGDCEKTIPKNFWSEEEEFEIKHLFEEFQNRDESPDNKDVADFISENLINNERTRRMVIKKLKQMGLIAKMGQLVRKPVRSKDWTQEEIEELKYLYEEHKNAVQPLERIMDFKVEKTSKYRVVKKLLELGLINDRKELHRKKIRKEGGSKRKNTREKLLAFNDSTSSLSSGESESDSDESPAPRATKVMPTPNPVSIQNGLRAAKENGLSIAIEWIADLLEETANDREEDNDFQPIPILALGQEHNDALASECFQELLHLIGLQAPLHLQEMFWRIPSSLKIHGLRKRVEFLRNGNLEDCNQFLEKNVDSSDRGEIFDAVSVISDNSSDVNNSSDSEGDVGLSRTTDIGNDIIENPELFGNHPEFVDSLSSQRTHAANRFNQSDSDDNSLIISGRNVLTSRSTQNTNQQSESDEEPYRRQYIRSRSSNQSQRSATINSSDSDDSIAYSNFRRINRRRTIGDNNSDSQNLDLNVSNDGILDVIDKLGKDSGKRKMLSSDEDSPLKVRKVARLRVVSDSD